MKEQCPQCGSYELEELDEQRRQCLRCFHESIRAITPEEDLSTITPAEDTPPPVLDLEDLLESLVRIKAPHGTGTGFFIEPAGYVLTNAHVVGDETIVQATIGESTRVVELELRADGRAMELDLALLEVLDDAFPPPLKFSPDKTTLGETTYALGNPKNIGLSVTKGSVARIKGDAMQLNMTLNPGNSGGPVVNEQGLVIGVVSYLLEEVQGMGFAISNQAIQRFLTNALNSGKEDKEDV